MADYSLMEGVKKAYAVTGEISSAVASHEAKAGAHPVSGISGLAALIDAISAPIGCGEWDRLRTSVRAGHVPSDGQILNRADYPDMWAAISAGLVPVVSDSAWLADPYKRASFTTGNGTTTFRIPDENGKSSGSVGALFRRGDGLNSAGTSGIIQGDAIRDIRGTLAGVSSNALSGGALGTGAFSKDTGQPTLNGGSSGTLFGGIFAASNVVPTAADNHPVSVTGCWVVKVVKSSKIGGLS